VVDWLWELVVTEVSDWFFELIKNFKFYFGLYNPRIYSLLKSFSEEFLTSVMIWAIKFPSHNIQSG
jgi:hypothetical protein